MKTVMSLCVVAPRQLSIRDFQIEWEIPALPPYRPLRDHAMDADITKGSLVFDNRPISLISFCSMSNWMWHHGYIHEC